MKNKFIYLSVLALGLVACEPEFDNELTPDSYSSGEADFTTYVAIGNSLTAGYMDGTMFKSGQQNSFPNLLAQQFSVVGGGEFTQPSYADDVNDLGGLLLGGQPIQGFPTRMAILMTADGSGPVNLAGTSSIEVSDLQQTAYNNMGVPGAKSFHLVAPGYGNIANLATGRANPYFVRHATSPDASVLSDALSMNPTFFTNWIGNNDVLSYATSGGTGVNQEGNIDVTTYGGNDITDPQVFASVYSTLIDGLTANGAKGVVMTIPSVTSIPYFTTVPYNPLTAEQLGGDAVIDMLNAQLGQLKQVLAVFGEGDRLQLFSKTAANPVLIKDETLTDLSQQITAVLLSLPDAGFSQEEAMAIGTIFGQARHATADDLFTLTASGVIGQTSLVLPNPFNIMGVTYPLDDMYVLIPAEQAEISTATTQFNQIIRSIAASKNLAVADMNDILNQLVSGIRATDGQIYTADYFSGVGNMNRVLFSLDGVHPNARGYAFVTNEIIKVINRHYKAHLPLVNVAEYPGPKIVTSNN